WQERRLHDVLTLLHAQTRVVTDTPEHVLVQQALLDRQRQRPTEVVGVDAGQGNQTGTEAPVAGVGNRPLVASEFLIGGITGARGGAPQAINAIPRSQWIGSGAKVVGERRVVVHLLGGIVVEADVLALAEPP